jgi:hypothetical protein
MVAEYIESGAQSLEQRVSSNVEQSLGFFARSFQKRSDIATAPPLPDFSDSQFGLLQADGKRGAPLEIQTDDHVSPAATRRDG